MVRIKKCEQKQIILEDIKMAELKDKELNEVDGGMWINGMRPAGMFEGNMPTGMVPEDVGAIGDYAFGSDSLGNPS